MELHPDAQQLLLNSIAPSTKVTYDTALRCYKKYCLMALPAYNVGLSLLPPLTEEILMNFSSHCHNHLRLSYSTIKLYLCGLKFHYNIMGVPLPLFINFTRLQLLLRGIKRTSSHTRPQRLPITGNILFVLCSKLDTGVFSPFLDKMLKAVFVTAFFGFLRCAEFTCGDIFDPDYNLCVSDISLNEEPALLKLKQSKTDPFRQGVFIKLFCTGTAICPRCQLINYLSIRNHYVPIKTHKDPLFVLSDGSALSRSTFLKMFKQTFQVANLPLDNYTGHSFRIGAATSSAATMCIGDHMIKVLGRWKSDSYCRYIQTPTSALHSAQMALAKTCVR